jgi:uncharacterized membrane protein
VAPRTSCILLAVALSAGVFFRFDHLGRKLFWLDETVSSMRIAGYRESEVFDRLYDGHEIDPAELRQYETLDPSRGVVSTIQALGEDEPQNPPLYFVLARFWSEAFGSSPAAIRGLSAFFSLLAFPCLYWLCLELFGSRRTAAVAVVLLAVSPFYVVYAQEARSYSLWTLIVLVSCAALLRALRRDTALAWATYALSLSLGLYAYLYFAFVALAHGIYVAATERLRWTRAIRSYLLAAFAAALSYLPWLLVLAANVSEVARETKWMRIRLPKRQLIHYWCENLSYLFCDVHFQYPDLFETLCLASALALCLGSIVYLWRRGARSKCLFVLLLVALPALPLQMWDLLYSSRRTMHARYFSSCFLGIELAVAYLLSAPGASFAARRLRGVLLGALIAAGAISFAIGSQQRIWWNKDIGAEEPSVAEMLNGSGHPLLISDARCAEMMSLGRLLDPKVRLKLLATPGVPAIPERLSEVFLYDPSAELRREFSKRFRLMRLYHHFWMLAGPRAEEPLDNPSGLPAPRSPVEPTPSPPNA